MKQLEISASVLSADMANFEAVVRELKSAGVDMLHYDVMDGHFVPNLTFGMPVLAAIRRCTDLFLDVHLMIEQPARYARQFVEAGADLVTVHLESEGDIEAILRDIHDAGAKAGIVLKPQTPWEAAAPYLATADVVLVMTVEPGFGGQAFLPAMLEKIACLRDYIAENKLACRIEVDGGINDKTSHDVWRAGAEILVMGSYLFRQDDKDAAIAQIRRELMG